MKNLGGKIKKKHISIPVNPDDVPKLSEQARYDLKRATDAKAYSAAHARYRVFG